MAAIARIFVRNVMGTPNGFWAEYRIFVKGVDGDNLFIYIADVIRKSP